MYDLKTNPTLDPRLMSEEMLADMIRHRVLRLLLHYPTVESTLRSLGGGLFGGAIRALINSETVNDLDLIFPTEEATKSATAMLEAAYGKPSASTERAVTFKAPGHRPVQVLRNYGNWEGSPRAVLTRFDFTICQSAVVFTYDASDVFYTAAFVPDIANRRLTVVRSNDGATSLLRAFRFAAMGYTIDPDELAKIVDAVAQTAAEEGVTVAALLRRAQPSSGA